MKRGLSTTQKKVIVELVQSDITGKTIAEIAEEYDVSERTIYRWKNDPEFSLELERQTDINLKSFYYEANNRLKSLIRNGHSEQAILGAIKLVLQSQGKLRDVQEIDHNVKQDVKKDGLTKDAIADLEDLLNQ
ncbi:phBC6A51 family helix-turn-helix protein [Bacillus haynesii]|uniref:phBC6A51 family helix-turn-helix protein n=1 Tax=Bacillus haynesii TaxID=1925021 RepID=UPI00227E2C83|nr:phBC6A51 family helix-turn-helix protein [Bacillus haynesii]MCY8048470.1 phBC6A51 family helix-turn-helix protein [Bacillus haynesii]MCY8668808.1 phBC6A51 family helix-turn-helix protein [Bacillus haynesii]